MSTLKRTEPIGLGCQRLLSEQIESAIGRLTQKDGSARAAFVALRRADAALCLIEPALPRELARRERSLLNRISRELDAALLPAYRLDALDAHLAADLAQDPQLKAYRKQLSRQTDTTLLLNAPDRTFNPQVYRMVADLAELRGHVGTWPEVPLPSDRTPPGLRRAYTAARGATLQPPTTPKEVARAAAAVDRLALQLGLVNRIAPTLIKPQRKMLSAAAAALREQALLLHLGAELDTEPYRAWAQPLLQALRDAQPGTSPMSLLGLALAESPSAFTRRVQVYWSRWKSA